MTGWARAAAAALTVGLLIGGALVGTSAAAADAPATVAVGQNLIVDGQPATRYTVVPNTGVPLVVRYRCSGAPCAGVVITLAFPAGLTSSAATASDPITQVKTGSTLTIAFTGTLPAGRVGQVNLQVSAGTTYASTWSWRARIRGSNAALAASSVLTIRTPLRPPGNSQGDPILGDVTGDGRPDRTTLTVDGPDCAASVQPGLPGGGYAPAVLKVYVIPGREPGDPCPDMGVALENAQHKADRLAVAFFYGISTTSYNLYILRQFVVVGGIVAEDAPSYIGTADFDGDGRPDVWETSDQDAAFRTFLTRSNTLVPGPLHFTSYDPDVSLQFIDLNRDGYLDVITPLNDFTGSGDLIVVSGMTGAIITLERAYPGTVITPVDVNGDGYLDLEVTDDRGGPARVYINGGRGPLRFTLAP